MSEETEKSEEIADFPELAAAPEAVSEIVVTTEENLADLLEEVADAPPELEAFVTTVKRRGRPRKRELIKEEEESKKAKKSRKIAELTKQMQSSHVKMFENELKVTADGDCYAKVLPGCQIYLTKKERIIKLLTDEVEIEMIIRGGWMLEKPPRLPPLVTHKACFAFYIDGSKIESLKEIANDELRPWSSSREHFKDASMKPNVRRHPVAKIDGKLEVLRTGTNLAELYLTEYSAFLPRLVRLKKKIYYLSMNGKIHGNVLILYEYTSPGAAPTVLSRAQNAPDDEELEHPLIENPFENEMIEGPSGGIYLRVKAEHMGWSRSHADVLRYMINEPTMLAESNCLNREPPFMPPLIENIGVFVFFAAANFVGTQITCEDGLAPWSQRRTPGQPYTPRVRTIRKALVKKDDGNLVIAKRATSWTSSSFSLVETVSILARCQRLKKRILYIQHNNTMVIGNVCYIYEYLQEGPIPQPITYTTNFDYVEVVDELEGAEELEEELEEVIEVEVPLEDGLQNGYDLEVFDEDPLDMLESAVPYFDLVRQLAAGHFYLTVKDKRAAGAFPMVLEWIINSTVVEDRGILNLSKPTHPPIVRNDRAYAFFVASTAIIAHDVNRDDFSPWSGNGDAQNPTCYRTKVKKVAVIYDESNSKFFTDTRETADFKSSPYHLVTLYSVHPKFPRLRKKIYYVMETASRMVVSHALIIYDYKKCGDLPVLNNGIHYTPRMFRKAPTEPHDVENDVSDMSESEKTCPFVTPPCVGEDGSVYLQLADLEFWNDRNRQLHYLINKPRLVESLQCLNSRVPAHPPMTSEKAIYVYFVNREEVNDRDLTLDQMLPWSENAGFRTNRRPKCMKYPLALNRQQQLRVWKSAPRGESVDYQLHCYLATLPRASRLRKKVLYVLKNGEPEGHAMIIYNFTEAGPPVEPLIGSLPPSSKATRIVKRKGKNEIVGMEKLEIVGDSELQVAQEVVVEEAELLERPSFQEQPASLQPHRLTHNQQSAIWRIVRNTLGASSEEETFDLLFRLLFERNEPRLLQNVSSLFGVEILPEMMNEEEEELLDEEFEEHGVEIDEVVVELEGGEEEGELGEEDDIFFEHNY